MIETLAKIDFKPITPADKDAYEACLFADATRGCEVSFANLCLWGEQGIAYIDGLAVILARYGKHTVYHFPVGAGDKAGAVSAILADASARGIRLCLSGVLPEEKAWLEGRYPDALRFTADEGSFDYVYETEALATLSGKKYHAKRTHLNRFKEAYPDYRVLPVTEAQLPLVREMAERWYAEREGQGTDSDFAMEKTALSRALAQFKALSLDGLMLFDGDTLLAFTMGSRLSRDTLDIHFEKALVGGAYTAINYEFARYIREKHPDIRFLDREEDMGIEGLRRAKRSYHPHHTLTKYRAFLKGDEE